MYVLSCYNNTFTYKYSLQLEESISEGPLYYINNLKHYKNIYMIQPVDKLNANNIRIYPTIKKFDVIIYHIYGYVLMKDNTNLKYKFLQIENVTQPLDWSMAVPINKQSKYTYIDGCLIEYASTTGLLDLLRGEIDPCDIHLNLECIMA